MYLGDIFPEIPKKFPKIPSPAPPDLRSQVLGGPTEGFHGGPVRHPLLAEPEIRDLDVPVLVQHQVLQLGGEMEKLGDEGGNYGLKITILATKSKFWPQNPNSGPKIPGISPSSHLDVAIDDVPGVQVLEGRDDLGAVETRPILGENPLPGQVEKQLGINREKRGKMFGNDGLGLGERWGKWGEKGGKKGEKGGKMEEKWEKLGEKGGKWEENGREMWENFGKNPRE